MKISEITTTNVSDYLRIEAGEEGLIEALLAASRQYITTYTGRSLEELDGYEDLSIALYVLCAEMYDNRQLTVQNDKVNPVVQQILGAYCHNFL